MKFEIHQIVKLTEAVGDIFCKNEKVKIIDFENDEYLIQELDLLWDDCLATEYVSEKLLN